MPGVAELAIIFTFTIPLVLIVGVLVLIALKILKGGGGKARTRIEEEEARMIQDIHRGLMKMEDRIEALETLLFDEKRKGTNQ